MHLPSPIAIPQSWERRYQAARFVMYLVILFITVIFTLRVLFPTITQGFDFRSPASSRNAILSPRAPDNTPRVNGQIERGGVLLAETAVVGDFSTVTVTATLEKDSAVPETLPFSIRRSYQSFLFPIGTPVTDFPEETVYLVGDTYYALRDGTLYPFVSAAAFLSRFPVERALPGDTALLDTYPVSEEWLGYRVGSLLSNATGVFVVVSETEARPVGSAEIFLALGYNFEDVIAVNEEELGSYGRGRIFLLGATHPDGTVLLDQDTDMYFLIEAGTKRPLLPSAYRDFLLARTSPVVVSTRASEMTAACTLLPGMFGSTFACTAPIATLPSGFGNDFAFTLTSPEADIDLNTITVSFETAKNKQNMMTLLAQIKQRLLSRFLP